MNKSTKPISANQLVAHNLRRLRLELDLTQEQMAQRLAQFTGERWSKTSWSNAERSAETSLAREFNANEILALARAFNTTVSYFLEPPDDELPLTVFCSRHWEGDTRTTSRGELLTAIYGTQVFQKTIARTVRRQLDAVGRQMDLLDPKEKR
jgi:transcriptional regulator with XRE-family HTH domain